MSKSIYFINYKNGNIDATSVRVDLYRHLFATSSSLSVYFLVAIMFEKYWTLYSFVLLRWKIQIKEQNEIDNHDFHQPRSTSTFILILKLSFCRLFVSPKALVSPCPQLDLALFISVCPLFFKKNFQSNLIKMFNITVCNI